MKKLLIGFLIVLVVIVGGYVSVAYFACSMISDRLNVAGTRLPIISQALAEVRQDQLTFSNALHKYSDMNRVQQLASILADTDINRLALNYLNSDFSLDRNRYLGRITHIRAISTGDDTEHDKAKNKLKNKLKELEERRRHFAKMTENGPESDRVRACIELRDVENQIHQLRGMDWSAEFYGAANKSNIKATREVANAKNHNAVLDVVDTFEKTTIERLNRAIAERAAKLKNDENEVLTLREKLSWFNIWPVNKIIKMPESEK